MDTIIEIGAGEGNTTATLYQQGVNTMLYVFEPHAESFKKLQESYQYRGLITILPFAVDIGDNQEPLFIHSDGMHTLQPNYFARQQTFNMVWTIRLDTFMNLYNITSIDYLKIDAPQRAEMILESLGQRVGDLKAGSVVVYEETSTVPKFLHDHGFAIRGTFVLEFWRE